MSGKTIKPYATNAGWLGRTFKEIEKLCPNSNVKQGMNIVENINKIILQIDDICDIIRKNYLRRYFLRKINIGVLDLVIDLK